MRLPIYPRELAFATEISGSGAQRSENSLTFQIFFRLPALRKPGVIQILHKRLECLAFREMPRIPKKNPLLSPYAAQKRFSSIITKLVDDPSIPLSDSWRALDSHNVSLPLMTVRHSATWRFKKWTNQNFINRSNSKRTTSLFCSQEEML